MKKKNFLAVLSMIIFGCAVVMFSSCTKEDPVDEPGNKDPRYERFVSGAVSLPDGVERTKLSEDAKQMSVDREDQFKVGFKLIWDSTEIKTKKAVLTKSLAGADTIVIVKGKSSAKVTHKPESITVSKDSNVIGTPVITSSRSGQKTTFKAKYEHFEDEIVFENDSIFAKCYNETVGIYNAFTKLEFTSKGATYVTDTTINREAYETRSWTIVYTIYHSSGDVYTVQSPDKRFVWKKSAAPTITSTFWDYDNVRITTVNDSTKKVAIDSVTVWSNGTKTKTETSAQIYYNAWPEVLGSVFFEAVAEIDKIKEDSAFVSYRTSNGFVMNKYTKTIGIYPFWVDPAKGLVASSYSEEVTFKGRVIIEKGRWIYDMSPLIIEELGSDGWTNHQKVTKDVKFSYAGETKVISITRDCIYPIQ